MIQTALLESRRTASRSFRDVRQQVLNWIPYVLGASLHLYVAWTSLG
jgi:hypothetical protein